MLFIVTNSNLKLVCNNVLKYLLYFNEFLLYFNSIKVAFQEEFFPKGKISNTIIASFVEF